MHACVNRYGLGPGVYPKGRNPWPAHPNTLSFTVVVFRDEVTPADRAGKETRIEYIKCQPAVVREGILGGRKKRIAFDAGHIGEGLIASTWKNVEKSLKRKGMNADSMLVMASKRGQHGVRFPDRALWHNFPDVMIAADVLSVKRHPDYASVKNGDVESALWLVRTFLVPSQVSKIRQFIGNGRPQLVPVHAMEGLSENMIPVGMAVHLEDVLGLRIADGIVQINRAGHTGASGWYRLAHPAVFDGQVERGATYLMLDDFLGQGGTLANLRGHLERGGGTAIGAVALTGKAYSAKISPSGDTLRALRSKHGPELETWWRETFGYGFDYLTESEAAYLLRAESPERIRDKILAARAQ